MLCVPFAVLAANNIVKNKLVLGITTWGLVISGYFWAGLWPMLVATLLLIIVTAYYIKHYYFLENHIQKLYRHNIEFCLEGKAS